MSSTADGLTEEFVVSDSKAERQQQAKRLYQAYPKHIKRGAAIQKILRALATVPFDELMEAVTAFADAQRGNQSQFIAAPDVWFNQQRWNDDRAAWSEWKQFGKRETNRVQSSTNKEFLAYAKSQGSEVVSMDDEPLVTKLTEAELRDLHGDAPATPSDIPPALNTPKFLRANGVPH